MGASLSSSGVLGNSGDLSDCTPFRFFDLKPSRSLRKTGVEGALLLGAADKRDESELQRRSSSSGGGVGRWAGRGREALNEAGLAVTSVENSWLSGGGRDCGGMSLAEFWRDVEGGESTKETCLFGLGRVGSGCNPYIGAGGNGRGVDNRLEGFGDVVTLRLYPAERVRR